MRVRYVVGLDLGTSSVKALLLREDGTAVATASERYPIDVPRQGWAEQDPDAWWRSTCAAVHSTLSGLREPDSQVSAIAVGGQMHGAVLLDERRELLRPAIIWPDQRATHEAAALEAALAGRGLLASVGGGVSPGFMLASLAWCRGHEPKVWERLATALVPKDYLRYRLTGVLAAEPSDGSGIPLIDLNSWSWSAAAASIANVSLDLMPPLRDSAATAGVLTAAAAASLALPAGIPVYCGGSDQAMGAIGAGLLETGTILLSLSTGGQIVAPLTAPLADPAHGTRTLCHAVHGIYLALSATLGAGLSLEWMRARVFGGDDPLALADGAPLGAGGLLFLPYLAGERAPLLDPSASGVLIGLRLDHERAHLARAALEGIALSLRHALEPLIEAGVQSRRLIMAGGLAQHALFQSIVCDVLEQPVQLLRTTEQSALGAALLAAVGEGFFPDLRTACSAAVGYGAPIDPDPERAGRYAVLYERYRSLYPKLRDDMHALRRF